MKNQQETSVVITATANADLNATVAEVSPQPNAPVRRISPKKLLRSKWTAVAPRNKEKHFMVTKLVLSDSSDAIDPPLEFVELEAVYSKNVITLAWRELNDSDLWHQGWK